MLNYKLKLFIWNWSRGLWLILKTIIPLHSWTVRLQKGLLNMQTVCKRMDHCSNYLSMRIDLQRMHLLYVTHTHTRTHIPYKTCVAVFHLICSSLGPASQRRAVVVVVVGRYSLHSLEIRVNSGNHFQLPSSDYFGALACHCEMGLGFSAAKKRKKKVSTTALGCLLTAGIYWARVTGQKAKGQWDNCSRVSYIRVALTLSWEPEKQSGNL